MASRPVLTNFYPLYGGANDQVDPVLPVRRVFFQRVIPRYRLSTSETRDEGLGPDFVYAPVRSQAPRMQAREAVGHGDMSDSRGNTRGAIRATSMLYRLDMLPPKPDAPWLGGNVNFYV